MFRTSPDVALKRVLEDARIVDDMRRTVDSLERSANREEKFLKSLKRDLAENEARLKQSIKSLRRDWHSKVNYYLTKDSLGYPAGVWEEFRELGGSK